MTGTVDLVYDRLVAAEKLGAGTKYERLAAIAFSVLTGSATVHDLRLRGTSGVRHQIDATVAEGGAPARRILIEAKDYDASTVGLGIVRNFWAVVDDVRPDAAYIVTTQGFTRDALSFARAKNLRLAILRPPREEDWANIIRRVELELRVTAMRDAARVTWELHPEAHDLLESEMTQLGSVMTAEVALVNGSGEARPFEPQLLAALERGAMRLGGGGEVTGVVRVDGPTWLRCPGQPDARVNAWRWRASWRTTSTTIAAGEGVGGLLAELVLRTVDGEIHRMVTNRDIEALAFDSEGHVISRAGSRPTG